MRFTCLLQFKSNIYIYDGKRAAALTIDRDYSGMGDYPLSAEEFAAYDGGPWREGMELAALPVFRNTTRMDVANGFRTGGGDYAQLRRTMERLAAAAGADVAQAAVEARVPDASYLRTKCSGQ